MIEKLKAYGRILKESAALFLRHDPLRMAGATAFFTMFALPPILIILVQVLSLFINPQTIRHELFTTLSGIVGEDAVRQIVSVIKAVRQLSYNLTVTILVFIFLIFVATTVFRVIRGSITEIWGLENIPGRKFISTVQARAQALAVIFTSGILFSIGILIETIQVIIGNYFFKLFPSLSGLFNRTLGFGISVLIIALWFLILFRYLTDARPNWRIAWIGALFTSILFSFGKIILHILLTTNNLNNIYGASASVVLLLLFIFYSAMILYFGAAFTKQWAMYKEKKIVHRLATVQKDVVAVQ